MSTSRSLRSKILFLFIALIIFAFVTTIVAVLVATNQNVERQVRTRLSVGQNVLQKLIEFRGTQLFDSAKLLTSDFGFKAAVSDEDKETIQSALENHGARINADLMLLSALEGKLIASGTKAAGSLEQYPFPELLAQAQKGEEKMALVMMNNRLYQVVLVPVKAPVPVAWATIGFEINQAFVAQMKNLTNLDITILGHSQKDAHSKFSLTSTIPVFSQWVPQLTSRFEESHSNWTSLSQDHKDYVHLLTLLNTDGEWNISGILTASKTEESDRFIDLRNQLLLISLVTLLVSVLGAAVISGTVTRPILTLVQLTQRISQGDYSESLHLKSNTTAEISALAGSIESMQEVIAQREQRIIHQAYHDSLTGMPNRAKILLDLDKLIAQVKETQALSVLALNLNRFKQVNDTFGLQAGDQLLSSVALRLTSLTREQGLAARIGADEFILVLPCHGEHEIQSVIDDLSTRLARKFHINDIDINISARYGVARYPNHGDKADQLIRRASIALSQAKNHKAFTVFYKDGMDTKHLKTITLLNDLKSGVENNELIMHYQPKLDLRTREVAQAESLIRWIHPELGFISPAEFIPLAEQSGMMPELTRWVIKRVIQDLTRWRTESVNASAAINLSAYDLTYDSLPDEVHQWVIEAGLKPLDIILEVTESAVLDDPEFAISILQRFKSLGFALSIDDYGTGYSSLSQLKKMPVDELKIDMSFVRQLDQDKEDQVIVRSTIDMAHNIGLTVVAEGVENSASWGLLEDWGCDKLQGYYISKPLASDNFVKWHHQFDLASLQS